VSTTRLQKFDQHSIIVEVEISGRHVELRGMATYEPQSELGAVLKIHVADPAGEFDVILHEDRWQGKIVPPHHLSSDYRISLTTADLCTQPL
jgi:hypothetical protein